MADLGADGAPIKKKVFRKPKPAFHKISSGEVVTKQSIVDRGLKVGSLNHQLAKSAELWGANKQVFEEVTKLEATENMLDAVGTPKLKEVAKKLGLMMDSRATKASFVKSIFTWILNKRRMEGLPLLVESSSSSKKSDDKEGGEGSNSRKKKNKKEEQEEEEEQTYEFDPYVLTRFDSISEDSNNKIRKLEAFYESQSKDENEGENDNVYFNYLLLQSGEWDERDSERVPSMLNFVRSIVYVGKGTGKRAYDYYDVASDPSKHEHSAPKIQRIVDRWLHKPPRPYYVLYLKGNVTENYALDKESAMIEGLLFAGRRLFTGGSQGFAYDEDSLDNRVKGEKKFRGRVPAYDLRGKLSAEGDWSAVNELDFSRHVLRQAYNDFLTQKTWTKGKYPRKETLALLARSRPASFSVRRSKSALTSGIALQPLTPKATAEGGPKSSVQTSKKKKEEDDSRSLIELLSSLKVEDSPIGVKPNPNPKPSPPRK